MFANTVGLVQGQGDVVSNSKVTLNTVLSCIDDAFCGNSATNCGQLTSLLDPTTNACVLNAAACDAGNSEGDMRGRAADGLRVCANGCPNSYTTQANQECL